MQRLYDKNFKKPAKKTFTTLTNRIIFIPIKTVLLESLFSWIFTWKSCVHSDRHHGLISVCLNIFVAWWENTMELSKFGNLNVSAMWKTAATWKYWTYELEWISDWTWNKYHFSMASILVTYKKKRGKYSLYIHASWVENGRKYREEKIGINSKFKL